MVKEYITSKEESNNFHKFFSNVKSISQLNEAIKIKNKQDQIKMTQAKADDQYDKNTIINDNLANISKRNSALFNMNFLNVHSEKEIMNLYNSLDPEKKEKFESKKKFFDCEPVKTPVAPVKTTKSSYFERTKTTKTNKRTTSVGFSDKNRLTSGYTREKATGANTNANLREKEIDMNYILTVDKEKHLITTKNMFYKKKEVNNFNQVQKNKEEGEKKYLNDLFNDDFMKESQKEIDLELQSLSVKNQNPKL